jgi:phosphoglucomutase
MKELAWIMKKNEWLSNQSLDEKLKEELGKLSDEELKEAFDRDLEFGTGGLRGVIGPGTNRMNIYTVRRTTQGFADYLIKKYNKAPEKVLKQDNYGEIFGAGLNVAISYDSRINSELFAKTVAEVMAGNGIKAYIFNQLMPTPTLSFAVRNFKSQGGIMITASHNPSKYNGYKAYNNYGCQLNLDEAEEVYKHIEEVDIFNGVKSLSFDEELKKGKLIEIIGDDISEKFIQAVKNESLKLGIEKATGQSRGNITGKLNVVYTPLNGAGNLWVRRIMTEIGVKNVSIVKEQELPDGNFPTCPYPNPEKREALKLGLELCEELYKKHSQSLIGNQTGSIFSLAPDILIASDPDSDRVGVAVLHEDKSVIDQAKGESKNSVEHYKMLSGNQIGILIVDFIIKMRKAIGDDLTGKVVFKTIVTSKMVDAICVANEIEVADVLTGFKFIGEQISLLEDKGEEDRYLFGFEESYGYLKGSYVRDKDAINGAMLVCEMAAYYKNKGMTLIDALNTLYDEHGYFINDLLDYNFDSFDGLEKMKNIMAGARAYMPAEFCGCKVSKKIDYLGETGLPKSDVLEYRLENGSSITIRPSGTEPKIKIYLEVKGKTVEEGKKLIGCYASAIDKMINNQ